jgi:hypothetical protein
MNTCSVFGSFSRIFRMNQKLLLARGVRPAIEPPIFETSQFSNELPASFSFRQYLRLKVFDQDAA